MTPVRPGNPAKTAPDDVDIGTNPPAGYNAPLASGRILFVDDEKHLRNSTSQSLELAGLEATCFAEAELALSTIDRSFNGIVISDIKMPGMDGMTLMQKVLDIDPDLPIILVTGHADVQLAVDAMREGAYDFIEKPFQVSLLIEIAKRALEKRRLTLEVRALRSSLFGSDALENLLCGRSHQIEKVRARIRTLAETGMDVLIVGETGTGKDVAARAIHALSSRKDRPFVAINCGALPAEMIESELFGHEIGAFANAVRARFGKFEHAHGGTILLDEIESMPLNLQVKLLQVLQDRTVTRLGSNQPIDLDIRFMAASKVDLDAMVRAGAFRADLFYRLNPVTLHMPSLSERVEDIPMLFEQLAGEAANRFNRPYVPPSPQILARVSRRAWPGNVRQLKSAAERYVTGLEIFEEVSAPHAETGGLVERLAAVERDLIVSELAANGGNLKKTYESLDISRKSLYEKMQKFGLNREDYIAD